MPHPRNAGVGDVFGCNFPWLILRHLHISCCTTRPNAAVSGASQWRATRHVSACVGAPLVGHERPQHWDKESHRYVKRRPFECVLASLARYFGGVDASSGRVAEGSLAELMLAAGATGSCGRGALQASTNGSAAHTQSALLYHFQGSVAERDLCPP